MLLEFGMYNKSEICSMELMCQFRNNQSRRNCSRFMTYWRSSVFILSIPSSMQIMEIKQLSVADSLSIKCLLGRKQFKSLKKKNSLKNLDQIRIAIANQVQKETKMI